MSSTPPIDNPAGRLHRVLLALKERPPNHPILSALQNVLKVEGEEQPLTGPRLLRRLSEMSSLTTETRMQIEDIPDVNHDLLLRWTTGVDSAFEWLGRWSDATSHMHQHITDAVLIPLEHCADLLHRRSPEQTIEDDDLLGLLDLVREAIDAVGLQEELPPSLRLMMTARLREVEDALLRYRIVGFSGIEVAADALTGCIVRNPAAQSEQNMGWFYKLLANLGLVSKGVAELAQSSETVMKAIEAGQNLTQ